MTLVTKATRGAVTGNAWTSPANAVSDNSVYATSAPAKSGTVSGDWDFAAFTDAEIPVGSTINSVTIRVQYKVSTQASIGTMQSHLLNNSVESNSSNDATEPLADTNFDVAFTTIPSITDLKTAGRIVARAVAQRGNSNTAVTFSLDYIELQVDFTVPTQTGTARLSLASGQTPATQTSHAIKVRARKTNATHTGIVRGELWEGATKRSGPIDSSALSTSFTTYTLSIPDSDAATITDYSNLEIRLYGFSSAGSPLQVDASQVWLEIPASAGLSASLTGLASAGAFGTVTIHTGNVNIAVTGKSSAAAFGSATAAPGRVTVSITGLGSAAAFGAPVPNNKVTTTALASAGTFGSVTARPGGVTALPSALGSASALGAPTASTTGGGLTINPTGLASASQLGTATGLPGNRTASVSGLASAGSFGTALAHPGSANVSLTGLGSAKAVGTVTTSTGPTTVILTGLGSASVIGAVISSGGNPPPVDDTHWRRIRFKRT